MSATLSTELLDRYQRDGVVFPIRVLSETEVGEFRRELEAVAGESIAEKRSEHR